MQLLFPGNKSLKKSYLVMYDENKNERFRVYTLSGLMKSGMILCDTYDREIGRVVKQTSLITGKYEIQIAGKTLGYFKEKATLGLREYNSDFNGWTCKVKTSPVGYLVYSGETDIAFITYDVGIFSSPVNIEYYDSENEIMCAMVGIIIRLMLDSIGI